MSDAMAREAVFDLEVPVEVWLADEEVPLERLLELEPGGVLPLAQDPDGPATLMVNGAVVASGELVVIDGHFGFRVSAAVQPAPGQPVSTAGASGRETAAGAKEVAP